MAGGLCELHSAILNWRSLPCHVEDDLFHLQSGTLKCDDDMEQFDIVLGNRVPILALGQHASIETL